MLHRPQSLLPRALLHTSGNDSYLTLVNRLNCYEECCCCFTGQTLSQPVRQQREGGGGGAMHTSFHCCALESEWEYGEDFTSSGWGRVELHKGQKSDWEDQTRSGGMIELWPCSWTVLAYCFSFRCLCQEILSGWQRLLLHRTSMQVTPHSFTSVDFWCSAYEDDTCIVFCSFSIYIHRH